MDSYGIISACRTSKHISSRIQQVDKETRTDKEIQHLHKESTSTDFSFLEMSLHSVFSLYNTIPNELRLISMIIEIFFTVEIYCDGCS